MQEAQKNGDKNMVVMLVGNKSDLKNERQISVAEGTTIASKYGLSFLETSALDATNVEESFTHVLEEIQHLTFRSSPSGAIPDMEPDDPQNKIIPLQRPASKSRGSMPKCC